MKVSGVDRDHCILVLNTNFNWGLKHKINEYMREGRCSLQETNIKLMTKHVCSLRKNEK